MHCTCRGEKLFPSFVAALKAKRGTDEESKKIGVLVQVWSAASVPLTNLQSYGASGNQGHACSHTSNIYHLDWQELEAINNYLRDNKTPYLGGERPNQADLGLAPKLYHVEVAMREFKVHTPFSLALATT